MRKEMKKRYMNKALLLGIGLSVISLTSCEKYLTQEPRNSAYGDAFWKTAQDLNSAVAGNYALFRDAITSGNTQPRHFMYGDALNNNTMTIEYSGDGLEGIQTGNFTFQYNVENLGDWTRFYKVITMSNIIINRSEQMTDEMLNQTDPVAFRNRIQGQAYFMRALTYFYIARVWGDAPIVVEEYESPLTAPELPRDPVADVLKQAETDAQKAASLLSWTYQNNAEAKVTANRGSAYALLAHLYMWRATMSNVSTDEPIMADINSADTTIRTLVANGGYTLTDTANYFNTFIGRSPEGIFEINASEDQLEGSTNHIGRYFLRSQQMASGSVNRNFVVPSFLNNNFYRFETVWQWVWYNDPGEWRWEGVPTRTRDLSDVRMYKAYINLNTTRPTTIKYNKVNYRNPAQLTGAHISNNIIIFRLADMLLLQAEIAIHKDDFEAARSIINGFRTRNGSHPSTLITGNLTKAQWMAEYMSERSKELFLEGHLFFDGLRTRQYSNYATWLSSSRFRQEGFYWPLAPLLFKNNPYLRQTPYWRGKV